MTFADIPSKTTARTPRSRRRSIASLLAPLDQIATHSLNLVANHEARFEAGGETYELPRYLFVGPKGGDSPIRVGIFAVIHGDEPEGAGAIVQFIKLLEAKPELAAGYSLSFYPVCNPTGFEDGTRHSRSGNDLNREFWKNTVEPEVRLLQAELVSHSFQGIISLHTDNTSTGFYGVVRGATLTKHLVEPALQAAEILLARDQRPIIDGFQARNGVIYDAYEGMLSAPPKVRPRPFEIILETPASPPAYLKEYAFVAALQTILTEYRKFIAYAPNL
ncbi:MAG TPA: succinylglutamate desuccinylase/aspartoacylase family protein [Candidatus Saccharimonadales bacterium]|nr:succinylglutamate desuccinylase/aspartoacylase family protein [Candidatus Saccharimonadales bacterium]